MNSQVRRYADQAPQGAPGAQSGGSSHTLIILAAIAALAGGGYYLLKPVSDVAHATHQTIESVKSGGEGLVSRPRVCTADLVLTRQKGDSLGSLAKSFLPPGAFALYSHIASQQGGVNGFLTNLQGKDLQGVIDEVKKHGGDDAKRVIEKVEAKYKEAKGDVKNIDWQGLAKDIKSELPASSQKAVDVGHLSRARDLVGR